MPLRQIGHGSAAAAVSAIGGGRSDYPSFLVNYPGVGVEIFVVEGAEPSAGIDIWSLPSVPRIKVRACN